MFTISNLKKLSDMKISGNRIPVGSMGESDSSSSLTTAGTTENATEVAKPLTFEESLAICCPELREIDGRVVKRNKGKKGRRGSKGEEGGFYTWYTRSSSGLSCNFDDCYLMGCCEWMVLGIMDRFL